MANSAGGRRIMATLCTIMALLSSTIGAAQASNQPEDAPDTVNAIWKAQEVRFEYRGYNTLYSCGELRDKLYTILTSMGARGDIIINISGCDDFSGRARVEIVLASPVEATEENVRELTRYKTEEVLIARLHNHTLPTAENVHRFPAGWKTISFAKDRKLKVAPGDCELVQQLRREILPKLSVQIVRDNVFCAAAFRNIGRPQLTVAALVETAAVHRATIAKPE